MEVVTISIDALSRGQADKMHVAVDICNGCSSDHRVVTKWSTRGHQVITKWSTSATDYHILPLTGLNASVYTGINAQKL